MPAGSRTLVDYYKSMRLLHPLFRLVLPVLLTGLGTTQVIEFESGGLNYQTLTKDGVTIMFAHLPTQVRNYAILQVAVSNGSSSLCTIRPEDFHFVLSDGSIVRAISALSIIREFIRQASGDDVIKLVTTYEMGLYGITNIRFTNGYEKRRQSALAMVSSRRLKAAAAASAIAFIETKLAPGESTDGAVFYPIHGKPGEESALRINVAGNRFEFETSTPPLDH